MELWTKPDYMVRAVTRGLTNYRSVLERITRLAFLVCLLLTGCDFDPERLTRFVPAFFPIKRIAYHKTIFATCAVAVFELETGFGAKALERGQKGLEEALYLRANPNKQPQDDSSHAYYRSWAQTPLPMKEASTLLWTRIADAYVCLKDSKHYYAIFDEVSKQTGGFWTMDAGGADLIVFSPQYNMIFVVPN